MNKDERIQELEKRIAELEKDERKYWKPSKHDVGFFMTAYGEIRRGFDDGSTLSAMPKVGLIWETYEEAQEAIKLMKAKVIIKEAVYKLNGNQWVPRGSPYPACTIADLDGVLRFADYNVNLLTHSWLIFRNQSVADQLIKEFPDELKLILGE